MTLTLTPASLSADEPPRHEADEPPRLEQKKHASPDVRAYTAARRAAARSAPAIVITALLLIAGGLADVFLAVPAFNGVLGESPVLSWGCAIAFVALAIGASVTAGRGLKNGNIAVVSAAAVAVGLLIVGLLVLRITAAGINDSAIAFEGATQGADGALAELPIAIVFAALMLATSILGAIEGYLITTPQSVKSLRALDAELAQVAGELAVAEAEETRLVENVAIAEERIVHLDDDLRHALQGLRAFARELQELARTEIVRHLGTPSATSGLDLPLAHPATIDNQENRHDSV